MPFEQETDAVKMAAGRLRSRLPGAGWLTLAVCAVWPTGLHAQAPAAPDETILLAGREYSVAVDRGRGYPAFRWTGAPEDIFHRAALAGGRGTAATSWGAGIEVRASAVDHAHFLPANRAADTAIRARPTSISMPL